jgi:predicted membrane chloride channel (bestrophin family)
MTLWATIISLIYKFLPNRDIAKKMIIPTQPHSLLTSSLGLLLVFRTNSAYQRFVEGRKIWYVSFSTEMFR